MYIPFRIMSAVTASALVVEENKGLDVRNILSNLDVPDVVKMALRSNLKSYLEAIQVDGFEDKKKRKVYMIGNTGKCSLVYRYCKLPL